MNFIILGCIMLKRKAVTSIKNWINTKNKKCLVVQGARQTGKTYIIERFAEDNYEELLEINFKQMASAADIFSGDLTVDNMVMAMRFRFPEKKILPGKTLIFLDEIQECQEAITSLKFWAIDNRYDVIVSGSLLGIDYKRASSYPVGYVDYLRMYGIDFEEFLWGMGISEDMIVNLCGYLESKTVIPEAIHSQMMNYYRQYIAIGGMPEAVQKYVDTKDFREIDKIQRSLLLGYQYDIAHYATAEKTAEIGGFRERIKQPRGNRFQRSAGLEDHSRIGHLGLRYEQIGRNCPQRRTSVKDARHARSFRLHIEDSLRNGCNSGSVENARQIGQDRKSVV